MVYNCEVSMKEVSQWRLTR